MGLLGFGEIACCTPGGRALAGSVPRPVARRGVGAGPPQLTYGQNFTKPKVTLRGIADGERGTVQTLEAMKEAVLGKEGAHNSDVRILAQQIVSDVGNKDYVAEAQAIYDFMVRHVRYTLDPRGLEWVQTPWWTLLVMAQGDCDDHAVACCALAVALGHGCAFRTVKGDQDRPDEWSHVYAVIGLRKNGKELWLPADSTEKSARLGTDPAGAEKLPMRTWIVVPA